VGMTVSGLAAPRSSAPTRAFRRRTANRRPRA
jgi:hypothetical protein